MERRFDDSNIPSTMFFTEDFPRIIRLFRIPLRPRSYLGWTPPARQRSPLVSSAGQFPSRPHREPDHSGCTLCALGAPWMAVWSYWSVWAVSDRGGSGLDCVYACQAGAQSPPRAHSAGCNGKTD
jgi:hypothetical protein